MLSEAPPKFPKESEYIHPSQDTERKTDVVFNENAAHYGFMTIEQVNLLFKTLPIDLTYVDRNDKVIFTIEAKNAFFQEVLEPMVGKLERITKSVDTVLKF